MTEVQPVITPHNVNPSGFNDKLWNSQVKNLFSYCYYLLVLWKTRIIDIYILKKLGHILFNNFTTKGRRKKRQTDLKKVNEKKIMEKIAIVLGKTSWIICNYKKIT